MKTVDNRYSLVFDGNRANLRNTVNREEATHWFSQFSDNELQEHSLTVNNRTSKSNIPVVEEGKNITAKFNHFLAKSRFVSSQLKLIWSRFLKEFDVVRDLDGRIAFKKKEKHVDETWLPDQGLFKMKEFILGWYRFDPIRVPDKDKKTGQTRFKNIHIAQHMDDVQHDHNNSTYKLPHIPYNVNGKRYTTPLYGVYAPMLREMMFGWIMDFDWGRILQKWQMNCLYLMWEETYIAASRGAGKTFLAASLVATYLLKSVIDPRYMIEWGLIHYYGITHAGNKSVIEKIKNMMKKLTGSKFLRYSSADRTLYFEDNWFTSRVVFLSNEGVEAGRWDRPNMIIVDEAARIDDSVMEIINGQSYVQKVYISTIWYETKKNWFYEWLVEAELRQNTYEETMDELVSDLWTKHWMDKIKSLGELSDKEMHKKIVLMRHELFKRRPVVGLRYTLDDVEYKTKEEKDEVIRRCLKRWGQRYLLAEQYAEFLDEDQLFAYEKCIVWHEEIPDPKDCDMLVFWYDKWGLFDQATLCVAGLYNFKCYIFKSEVLDNDPLKQIDRIKEVHNEYSSKNRNIFLACDVSQARHEQRDFLESRWVTVDMPIVINWTTIHQISNEWFHLIGKELLVKITKEWFERENIAIPSWMSWDGSLLEELKYFQKVESKSGKTVSYEAVKGKDDQVLALLYCYYYMYLDAIKDNQVTQDKEDLKYRDMGNMDIYDYEAIQEYKKKIKREMEEAESALFAIDWY